MAKSASAEPGVPIDEPATEHNVSGLARRLAADGDWIASVTTDLTGAIHAELPELGTDEEMRQATYASTESNVRLFLEVAATQTDPAEAKLPPAAIEYARQFVRQGVTLDALLRAYHMGQARFVSRWNDAVNLSLPEGPEQTEAVEQGATLTLAFINALMRALVQRYAEERDRWVRSAAALRAEVVRALLAGEHIGEQQASRQLGYSLERNHLAFVVWSEGSADDDEAPDLGALERTAAEFATRLGKSTPLLVQVGRRLVAGWIGGYEEIDLAMQGRVQLPPDAAVGVRLAVGSPGRGRDGFIRSYHEARHARRVAELSGRAAARVTSYPHVALTALASSDLDQARAFVVRELGPLAIDDDSALRLAGTLRVYLEERSSPSRTAHRLGVHANTIPNRIRAIEDLLGHSVDSRVAELLVALRLAPLVREDDAGRR
jgi:PucR C-terminal helix-turn-helix domain/GGDEF-like domain